MVVKVLHSGGSDVGCQVSVVSGRPIEFDDR
jgi:hypothetical protein